LSLTLSLVAVLISLLFMGDLIGRLFREFAMTLVITILISAVVSLTLVPMLCAKLLRPHHGLQETGKPASWFDKLVAAYGHLLTLVLRHRLITLSVAAATLGLTIVLYATIPKGLFPTQDTAVIQAVSEAPRSISYEAMTRHQMSLVEAILQDKDVRGVSSFIGVDGTNMTLNTGRLLISLKPVEERSATIDEVIRRLNGETAHLAGLSLYMQPVQDLTIDTTASRTKYQFVLQDANPEELDIWARKLVERLELLPQLSDVTSNAANKSPALYVKINLDSAAHFGITPATLDNVLYDAFGQRIISTIFTQENQYRVILEADPKTLDDLDALSAIYLPSADGGQVPLAAIASVSEQPAPIEIDHAAQFPSVTISFNLAPGISLGEAIVAIRKAQANLESHAYRRKGRRRRGRCPSSA
jgi:multidrug efflux pump